jgi:hypothetical protein
MLLRLLPHSAKLPSEANKPPVPLVPHTGWMPTAGMLNGVVLPPPAPVLPALLG